MTDTITKSITVKGDKEQIFKIWSNFENFPYFMKYIENVDKLDERKSRWKVKGPLGIDATWDAETTLVEQGQRIAWNTKDNVGTVTTSGQVTFTDLPQGQTQVTVTMNYSPVGGKAGEIAARLFANPEKQLEEDLANYKHYVETISGGRASV